MTLEEFEAAVRLLAAESRLPPWEVGEALDRISAACDTLTANDQRVDKLVVFAD